LLPAGMEITSYNHHVRRLLSSQRLWSSNQDYRVDLAFALIQSGLSRFVRRPGNPCGLAPPNPGIDPPLPFSRCPLRLNLHHALFPGGAVWNTAPPPVFRVLHQPTLYRILMNVTQLLYSLALAPNKKADGREREGRAARRRCGVVEMCRKSQPPHRTRQAGPPAASAVGIAVHRLRRQLSCSSAC
jgi:hypothetical protein